MRRGASLAASGLALALLAAGCAEPSYPTRPQPPPPSAATLPPAPTGPLPVLPMPGYERPTPAPQPLPRQAARDSCGASELQALVGRPRTAIPVPLDPSRQRVACTTCPAADDVDPGRITFLFDARSGLIRQIRCG